MSKPNKSNRFHCNKPDFKEIPQTGAQNKTSAPAPQKPVQIVCDPDENTGPSFFTNFNFNNIGTFFGGCWEKLSSCTKSVTFTTWGWVCSAGQWIWGGLRQIPSYCVIRWDTETENETKLSATSPKTESAKVAGKPEGKKQAAPSKIEYDEDEDELDMSRWWNIGIKSAAVAASLLIIVGGYFFAVKPLLTKAPMEMAAVEKPEDQQNVNDAKNENALDVVATSEQVPAIPREIPLPTVVVEQPKPELSALAPPPPGSFFGNDPFSVQTATVAEAAPPVANNAYATANVAKEKTKHALAALQPLSALETNSKQTALAQLQPLAALKSSALPSVEVAATPVPIAASVEAPVAGNFAERRAQRNGRNNATFSQAPTPPVVNTMTQTTVQQTLPVIEPLKEIVPQIPFSGTVQDVPPPIPTVAEASPDRAVYANESTPAIPKDAPVAAPPVSSVIAKVPPVHSAYANESAPAIPKDAPVAATTVPIVTVPTAPAVESSPKMLSSDSQPIDRQLRERLHELRGESDVAPSNLRFERATTASESALRFTPRKQSPPPAITDGGLLSESASALQGLLPSSSGADQGTLRSENAALAANAPKPVWAVAAPAYRNEQADGEKGMTFQNRNDSEIKRSPVETQTYTVRQGDTYMTISDQFYGTSLLYSALAAHNQRLGIGWRPTEGVIIEVPTAEYLRTHYGGSERSLVAQNSGVRYVVQEGDTVFRLATDKLQDSTRWREIYSMNSDHLQDVRDLKPGMEIWLPSRRL